MKGWLILIAGLSVLFFGVGPYWSATWLTKWTLLLALSGLKIPYDLAKKISLWHLPLISYVMLSLIWVATWPANSQTFDAVTTLALQKNALYALAAFLLLLNAMSFIKAFCSSCSLLAAVIWALGCLSISLLPLSGANSAPNNGLWFGNPSMGAGLLACLMAFAFQKVGSTKRLITLSIWGMTFIAILKTKASVPWGVLGVVTAALLLKKMPWKKALFAILLLAPSLICVGEYALGSDFWDQNGRFEIWSMAWNWFLKNGNLWWGQGFGTSQILIPIEQTFTGHFHGSYFLWLHNDWLQLMIEGGIFGSICLAVSVGRLLLLAYSKSSYLFASLCGFITLGLFNYPLRMPIHCMCLVLLCGLIEANA